MYVTPYSTMYVPYNVKYVLFFLFLSNLLSEISKCGFISYSENIFMKILIGFVWTDFKIICTINPRLDLDAKIPLGAISLTLLSVYLSVSVCVFVAA